MHFVKAALSRFDERVDALAPELSRRISDWTHILTRDGDRCNYFLHEEAFPALLFPWWIECAAGREPEGDLHPTLAYATLNGYYFIRLIDDVMDGDAEAQPHLLPAAAFFHTNFQSAFAKLFPPGHAFWSAFERIWTDTAAAAIEDHELGDYDLQTFRRLSARKVGAGLIPITAVEMTVGDDGSAKLWREAFDLMGAWHQFKNDFFDILRDREAGARTFALSHAGRRLQDGETLEAWLDREGVDWADHILAGWMAQMEELAATLGSQDFSLYLSARRQAVDARFADVRRGFDTLAQLSALQS